MTAPAPIEERLRAESQRHLEGTPSARRIVMQLLSEAADEHATLRRQVEALTGERDAYRDDLKGAYQQHADEEVRADRAEARLAKAVEAAHVPSDINAQAQASLPSDVRDFGQRHGIPVFGEATYVAGFVEGYRASSRRVLVELNAGGGKS